MKSILDQLEDAERKATVGPWNGALDSGTAIGTPELDIAFNLRPEDSLFIALSRNHIRSLVDVARAAKELIRGSDLPRRDSVLMKDVDSIRGALEKLEGGEK